MKSLFKPCLLTAGLLCGSPIVLASEACGQYDIVPIMDRHYIVQNNVWGASTAQCVRVLDNNTANFTVSRSEHKQQKVAGYPSIFIGCHWGICTKNSLMPLQVSKIVQAPFKWEVTRASSGKWSIAAEAWFSPNDNLKNGYNGGAELMVWIDSAGMQPAGTEIGTVMIGGSIWEVWFRAPIEGSNWNYIAYRQTGQTSINIDFNEFIKDARARGYIADDLLLHVLEAGTELMEGGAGFATNTFDFDINTGSKLTVMTAGKGSVTSAPIGIDCGVKCTANFAENTSITLKSKPDTGYTFSGWSGGCTNTSGDCVLTLKNDTTVRATFNVIRYPLTVTKVGNGGTVTSAPPGINCGANCVRNFNAGTSITLIPKAEAGYSFGGWSGDCTNSSGNCVLAMNTAKNVTAIFNTDGSSADLLVTYIDIIPANPSVNSSFRAKVGIKNQGDKAINGVYLDVWTDQATAPTCGAVGEEWTDVRTIAAGASKTLMVKLRAGRAGNKTLRAFVDSWCEINESNETNNQLTKTYTVK